MASTKIASNQIEARRVALIGDVTQCSKFANRLKTSGIKTIGSIRLPKSDIKNASVVVDEAIREIISDLRALRADDVIILTSNEFMPVIFEFTSFLMELPVGVHIVPVAALNVLASTQIAEFGDLKQFRSVSLHFRSLTYC